ncbi:MBL fold metallo-hydrolase [Lentibacillus cibarius]|uniref:MBL fold metallo-hydrolase n=1 Tax=Lentibacillus cibarius TaxID=2583219 RepID=A0A5S3QGD9_9BACI|nr:MBL fold metallo-hydrolase [Lentibacillus cibarius]TMN20965.1 MBL fold metallo-hydrolase [Lentibacillus cibarius]
MQIKCIPAGPLSTNCYIVSDKAEALIIDPGGDFETIVNYLNDVGVTPEAILLTHAHFDHIGAVSQLRSYFGSDVYLHASEQSWLEDPVLNGSLTFMRTEITTATAEYSLVPGNLQIGTFSFEVIHTPGHSPGSVSFLFHNASFIVSGDVLFNGGIGRTDLPGGDIKQLERSIRESLYQLPDVYTVYPGHGPETTIGNEKRQNPFFTL